MGLHKLKQYQKIAFPFLLYPLPQHTLAMPKEFQKINSSEMEVNRL